MRKLLAAYLIALGLGLVALGRRLAGNDRPGSPGQQRRPDPPRLVDLPKRQYREIRSGPGRLELWCLGLEVLFNSVAWATVGA